MIIPVHVSSEQTKKKNDNHSLLQYTFKLAKKGI